MYFPLVVKYVDRQFPETVEKPNDVRNNIPFAMLHAFPRLNQLIVVERVKGGYRTSDDECYQVDSSKRRCITLFFDRLSGN